jgi:hypothetical protein
MPPPSKNERARLWEPGNAQENLAPHNGANQPPSQTVRDEVWHALVAVQCHRVEKLRQNLARQKRHAQGLARQFADSGDWKVFRVLLNHVTAMQKQRRKILGRDLL